MAYKHYYKKSFSPVIVGKMHRDNRLGYIHEIKPLIDGKRPFWVLATHVIPQELGYIDDVLQTEWGYEGRIYFMRDGAVLIYYIPEKS